MLRTQETLYLTVLRRHRLQQGEPDGVWPSGSLHGIPCAPRLAGRRHCAKLLEPAERILVAPMLDDLAARNAEDRGRRERKRSAAWRNAHEFATGVRATEDHARGHFVALGDQILDLGVEVGKGADGHLVYQLA